MRNCDILDVHYLGEANAHGIGTDTYACSFSKMITSWREIWNQRTNGITDVQFPFGFVQVNMKENHEKYIHTSIAFYSYQQLQTQVNSSVLNQ
jgi:hypothetical protein